MVSVLVAGHVEPLFTLLHAYDPEPVPSQLAAVVVPVTYHACSVLYDP